MGVSWPTLKIKKSSTSWYGKYPIIYTVLYIPGGCLGICRFFPSSLLSDLSTPQDSRSTDPSTEPRSRGALERIKWKVATSANLGWCQQSSNSGCDFIIAAWFIDVMLMSPRPKGLGERYWWLWRWCERTELSGLNLFPFSSAKGSVHFFFGAFLWYYTMAWKDCSKSSECEMLNKKAASSFFPLLWG